MKLIAYDFDGTIYDGDSSYDFYKFCFKKNKKIAKYWIKQFYYYALYILGFKSKTEIKEAFFSFLKEFNNIEEILEEFWNEHMKKIKGWYIEKKHDNDLIISASPEFLLEIPAKKFCVKDLIASQVDIKTGKFLGENCRGEEKVKRIKEKYKNVTIEEMYTDSMTDLPMIELSKKGYMVIKNKIVLYSKYQPSLIKKIKYTFLNPKFMRFILVGCINAINGILFSFLYSLFITDGTLAFVIGYITSLMISYLLNSIITFKDKKMNMLKFIKFCISYIPNFLIQLICVYILIVIFNFYKIIAYTISAIIGIPVTYILLSIFTFKERRKKHENK